ncbi:MAG: hypothetical protein NZ992_08535, partial [Candidatus Korarchaeum sp.]|nr:hypothetical protein [Candidatus Korarchaeum sp.]MDW8034892.1 hypothetical protein [Candidatus Korarchaeum sp.]
MKKAALILITLSALLVATLPFWYSPPSSRTLKISGRLKDIGSRTIVVTTDPGDIVVELRGEYAGGLK